MQKEGRTEGRKEENDGGDTGGKERSVQDRKISVPMDLEEVYKYSVIWLVRPY